jgi:aspartate/methionine/tyrosine aminotransferase
LTSILNHQKISDMSAFQPFAMERFMSAYEQEVAYNLSESGVHPMLLRELLDLKSGSLEELLATDINYAHANGRPELRENIARMYDGATKDNVLVTVGAIEANYNTLHTVLGRGDEVVIQFPNYMQLWGVAKNYDCLVRTFSLKEERDWEPDLDALENVVTEKTRLIAICNPNNPTGRIFREHEMDAIIRIADNVGAWILADEVYAGAEQKTDERTPSFYGRYEKVLAVGSMSKAYGLPGLRTGWVVGPRDVIDQVWARHEYNTLSASMLSNKLAALALSEEVQPLITQRARDYVRRGFPILQEWMDGQPGNLRCIPPDAAAIAFVRYDLDINSTDLVMKLIKEQSVMVVPGDHFGLDGFLRVSFGLPEDYLRGGLDRISKVLLKL